MTPSLSELVNELLAIVTQVEAAEAQARNLRNQLDNHYAIVKAQIDATRPAPYVEPQV